MKDFFQYMLGEVKSGRMQKEDAILRIRQFQAQMPSHGITHSGAGTTRSLPDAGVLMLEPVWKEQVAFQTVAAPEFSQRLVVLCELDHISERSIEALMKGARCIKLHASQSGMDERFQAYALQLLTEVQKILKENLRSSVLIQIAASSQSGQQPFVGLLGLLKAAEKENPKIVGQFVELESSGLEGMVEKLNENSQYPKDKRIWYEDGKRLVLGWNEMNPPETTGRAPWKNRGIYLITGGAGGLGLVFAKDIARRVREATLVLVGRSMPDEGKQAILEELKAQGARAEYRQVDISRKEEVSRLVLEIREEYGGLDGVLHSAGVIQDRFIIHKTQEEFVGVLAPKVAGLVNLDQATKEQNLDFFIFFSSIAGIMGNPGQADYSAANAFMDAYASYRNSLAASKERKGQTLSVNWPLWKDGGMQVNDDTEKAWKNIGMVAMQSSNGVKALYDGLAAGLNQVLVIEGELSRLRKHILEPQPQEKVHVEESASSEVTLQLLLEKTLHQLKLLFGEVTKLSIDKIDVSEPLESYGIDSIMITRLNQKLQGIFGEISMTLFYEYQTLEAVAEYFIADYHKECVRWTGLGSQQKPKAKFVSISAALDVASELSLSTLPKEEKHHHRVRNTATDKGRVEHEPIAIIGISGRYPQAKNMEEYWSNLEQGKDCITEIPAGRWKREGFYCPDIKEAVEKGKSYSKSGGFVEDFADFDPLFFNISPREAMSMDPQERIFLEECWKVFEDAGYSREQLAAQYHGRIGVFAGITGTGFNLYGPKLWEQGHPVFPRTSFSSVANRISYFLNLKGPSMPIDTMCSSSLTAIHEACEHIYNGECEMAVAGGVNLYLHPSSYIFLSTMRMLSPEGRCKSFGEGGNGFVPGEGAGVVLLKPLSRAIADKDHIYAVIRGTRINHGGKTNGYTVPNPVAQGELIREAFDKAGVNARAVSYIEAHGTGTELGDPIEITGLTQAFRKDTQDTGFCAVGSVKSNIGHLEAAAGIAGIAKIILQMKNRKIVPSLHSQKLNSNINFAKTPFVVQQRLSEWERPIVEEDGEKREYPRIAGISSFGAGGANAHIVLEEYLPAEQDDFETSFTPQRPVVIVLSAKSDGALKEQASQLAAAMDRNGFFDHDLVDVAYTLQTGREAMEERLAVVVESVEELRNKLMEFIGGRQNIAQLYRGQAKRDKESLDRVSGEEVLDETVDLRILAEKYGRIAELWADGAHMDWGRLYGDVQPRRIPLPTYPFARERYWIDVDEGKPADGAAAHLHPLLYQNTFVPSEQSSNSTISGQELTQKYVIDLRDEAGQVCERIKGDSCKEADTCENTPAAIMLQPCWKEQAASDNPMAPIYERHVVMLCETNTITAEELGALFPGVECITLQSGMEEADRRFEMYAVQVFENIKGILNDKPKGKVLVQIVTMPQNEKLLFAGLSGILKTAQKENPKIHGQLIEVEGTKKTEGLIEILKTSSRHPEDSRIRFAEGKRWVPVWSKVEIPPSETAGIPWKNCGVYLITGGARGLGLIFAKEIARQAREVTLVLTGRSLLEQDKQTSLEELKALGARVEYRQVDVTRKEAVVGLIENIRQTYGGINGILHSAGIIQDNYIIKKTSQEFRAVLAPKVAGLVNLDQASKNIALDFFILFSSGSGVGGNAGQSDYAAANAFMDAYAWYRNILVSSKERIGKTLSINWPLWKDGGMRLDQETEKAMQKVGMYAMRTETGINALYQSIACISNQVMVIEGDIELVSKMMVMEGQLEQSGKATRDQVKGSEGAIVSSTAKKAESGRREDLLREKTVHHLKTLLSSSIGLPVYRIEEDASFENYGVDSIKSMELTDQLEKTFYQVSRTLFFEYPNIRSLTDYFLESHQDQLIALFGIEQEAVAAAAKADTTSTANKAVSDQEEDLLREKTVHYLKTLLSSSIGLPVYRIEEDTSFENYGVDSIKSMELTDQLEKTFYQVSRTLFFEYPNMRSLTDYFLESHQDQLIALFGVEQEVVAAAATNPARVVETVKAPSPIFRSPQFSPDKVEPQEEKEKGTGTMDIAVIGISGKYPGAENLQEFWRNLQESKDCITEIPKERWEHNLYFDEERNKPGKTYCKWGGFMERINLSEPAFFHLTPYEVSLMDPMEQLFLETIWNLLESAGYTREVLQKKHQNKVGVYIGATYHKYCSCDTEPDFAQRVTSFGSVAVANPMSHYFNFQGPSISVDTMSSSSAVAVHMACESLVRGECQIAVAGGGNLLTSPKKYIESSQNQLIGSHQDSRSFADGDGYLPAEGVGAVLLKPLQKAVQDGDCILAVIKSTATNHGGHSNGYTIPNPNAQTQLVEENFLKAGINPRTISYVEAAANGSTLGDPIELVALNKAFQKFTNEQRFCAIGSVKSNIGHAEAASGISQLTKVILQLWHRKLVPTIKAEKLNPNINFSNTPFYLQREVQEWERPVIEIQGEEREYPLRATVSSFGAGGSNVHFILEEYISSQKDSIHSRVADHTEVVVLSDINRERLIALAKQLLEYLEQQSDDSLQDIAFTLQTGREAMTCRAAIIASTREELLTGLRELLELADSGHEPEGASIPLFIGESREDSKTSALLSGKIGETISQLLLEEGNMGNIAIYWTQGGRISWEALHKDKNVRRIPLPTALF